MHHSVVLHSCVGYEWINPSDLRVYTIPGWHVAAVVPLQVKKETKFDPPFFDYKQLGVYPSNIRANFNGFVEANLLRDAIAFFDDNAFVTLWTTIILLEAQRFSKPPRPPSGDQLQLALKAVSTYHDKNRQPEDSVLVFWPQTYNATTKTWVCGPANLGGVAHSDKELLDFVTKILDDLGLGHLWDKFAASLDQLYVTIHLNWVQLLIDRVRKNVSFKNKGRCRDGAVCL